jgi:hypothetical protein
MNKKTKFITVLLLVAGMLAVGRRPVFSQPLSYDRFAGALRQAPSGSSVGRALAHFPLLPFEIVRWPISQGLYMTEKHHLDKKALWVLEELESIGIIPHFNFVSVGGMSAGGDFDVLRMINVKESIPDAVTKGWIRWSHDVVFEVGAEAGLERIADTGFGFRGVFMYDTRPEEHFYGIGPNTSRGEGTAYEIETTKLGTVLSHTWNPMLRAEAGFGYRNINLNEGEDEGRGQVSTHFLNRQFIPGLDSDDLFDFTMRLEHDTRDTKGHASRGGYRRLGFGYHRGLSDDAEYFKYEVDLAQYFPLGSPRRVLAVHFYGEHNDEVGNNRVPFHQMAKLGGYGAYPRLSRPLRGFDFNRFFDESAMLVNIEYRYTIWEYREWKTDAVIFWDEGQVFGEFSDFQFKDFRESYGGGVRVGVANHILLSLEVAHGDEGTNFYVKSKTPF